MARPIRTASRKGITAKNKHFATTPAVTMPRSTFNTSRGLKTAFDAGYLVPIYVQEILPGDTINLQVNNFVRLATPLKPLMDNLHLDIHWWFCANRYLWSNWQRFMGEQDNPDDSTDFLVPVLDNDGAPSGSGNNWLGGTLGDYLGLPTYVQRPSPEISALPFRAYHKIWNDWYRDQNLQDSQPLHTDDGPDDPNDYFAYGGSELLLRRGKRHDYFSACLPFPQKGPAVGLPLGETAPVIGDGNPLRMYDDGGTNYGHLEPVAAVNQGQDQAVHYHADSGQTTADPLQFGPVTGLEVDLTGATAATINELRTAFAIQRLYERDARGGSRYVEILRSHFQIQNHPDARLQRPEFLGGSSQRIHVNPVAATNFNDDANSGHVLGDLAGYGTSGHTGRGFVKSFVEHGYVIGLASVRADITYQQGLEKHWTRRTKTDYYWPSLSHLGEQAVLNKEIYCDGVNGDGLDDEVFGYIPRYDEYRFGGSRTTGVMRSTHPTPIDVWHLGLHFENRPNLNETFIEDRPPVDRALTVQVGDPQFLADFWFQVRATRPMPAFGIPGMIDHF